MEARLTDSEIACIKRLAELYEMGQTENGARLQQHKGYNLGVPDDKWEAVMGAMESYRAIDSVDHADTVPFFSFRISPNAAQFARQIHEKQNEKKEPEDIVEQLKQTAKSNRYLAWIIIGFVVLTAAVTFANQSIQLLERIGVIAPVTKK